MKKLIAVTMVIGAIGAIFLAQHSTRRVACETCHQGWKMQVDQTAALPPNIAAVMQKTDENLAINGKRIVVGDSEFTRRGEWRARRLDPDSERFRDALMKDAK